MKLIRLFLGAVIVFTTSCSRIPIKPSPSPPFSITVGITPSLAPVYQTDLSRCADETSGMSMILSVSPRGSLDLDRMDLIIYMGESSQEKENFSIQIGWEDIIVVASQDVNVGDFNKARIHEAFSTHHSQFNSWTYPEDHEIRILFEHAFEIDEVSPYSRIAPDVKAMLEALQQNPNSIGYIPSSWYFEDIQKIPLDNLETVELTFPVLATTKQRPQGLFASYMSCLQQEFLASSYP